MPLSFEEELQHNTILHCLCENSKVNAILVTDEDGIILYINEAFSLNYGYVAGDLCGRHGRVIFTHKDQRAAVPEREIETTKQQGVARDRNYIVHRNGEPLWTDGESVLIKSDSGNTYLFKVVQNLQEQVALEAFLQDALKFSDNVVSAINEGLVVIDKEQRILRTNAAFYRLLEIGPALVEGKRFSEIDCSVFSSAVFLAELNNAFQRRTGKERLLHYNTAGGTAKVLRIKTALLDGDENVQVLIVLSDVTATYQETDRLQRSEQRFRSLIENSPVASCVLTGRGMMVELANETMIAYWGKGPAVLGKPLREALPELEGQPFLQLLDDVFTTGETYASKEAPAVLVKEGVPGTCYFDFTYSPLRDNAGAVYAVMTTAVDVTDRVLARLKIEEAVRERTRELREANEALLQSNRELKESNYRLEEFAHAASHDLKEPIRKIRVFNSQLRNHLDGQLNDRGSQLFERVNASSERMGRLIDDLLLYSHVNDRPPGEEKVDLNVELAQVIEDLELHIQAKDAVIRLEPLPTVRGYGRQLRELFQNLLANALKFTKAAALPHIVVKATVEEVEGMHYHRISVADNGIGFETEHAEKIFRMFTRLHSKGEYEGTGVGLTIARKVAENHKGFIRAESVLSDGATFSVFLPL